MFQSGIAYLVFVVVILFLSNFRWSIVDIRIGSDLIKSIFFQLALWILFGNKEKTGIVIFNLVYFR
ncbi:hypothetical protein DLM75_20500 [Leptospira stimsonii]|uniref:Uncharacterized protein n=1 Tax=Leptospira stimsonii TaxID=2202203 RepID=A0A396YSM1_9LEPT|nr:hypothetical protein DLM75_20500 [Leptospira stimsonii]